MKCEELLAALNQYVDGDLEPGLCDALQAHLNGCNPCQIVVDNIRQTIRLYRASEPYELPPALQVQLGQALRQRWKEVADDDRPLVGQAQAGDFAALEVLLVKYQRQVFALRRRITGQHQDAEEVTQQTFVSVIQHLGDFRQEAQFRTWLLRIASNHALALLRKRAVRAGPAVDAAADPDDTYAGIEHPQFVAAWRERPEEIAVRRETRQHVEAALEELDEKYPPGVRAPRHRGALHPRNGRHPGHQRGGRQGAPAAGPAQAPRAAHAALRRRGHPSDAARACGSGPLSCKRAMRGNAVARLKSPRSAATPRSPRRRSRAGRG